MCNFVGDFSVFELCFKEYWRFSDMAYSAYPLNALDTVKFDGTTSKISDKFLILND